MYFIINAPKRIRKSLQELENILCRLFHQRFCIERFNNRFMELRDVCRFLFRSYASDKFNGTRQRRI